MFISSLHRNISQASKKKTKVSKASVLVKQTFLCRCFSRQRRPEDRTCALLGLIISMSPVTSASVFCPNDNDESDMTVIQQMNNNSNIQDRGHDMSWFPDAFGFLWQLHVVWYALKLPGTCCRSPCDCWRDVGIDLGQHGSTWVNKVVRDSMDGWYDLVPGAFFWWPCEPCRKFGSSCQRWYLIRLSKPVCLDTLWLFNIAMENSPFIDFIDGLPIKHSDFPWQTVSHKQMVIVTYCDSDRDCDNLLCKILWTIQAIAMAIVMAIVILSFNGLVWGKIYRKP